MTIHSDIADLLAEQCKEAYNQPLAYPESYRFRGETCIDIIDEPARLREMLTEHGATLGDVVARLTEEITFLSDRLKYVTDSMSQFDIE